MNEHVLTRRRALSIALAAVAPCARAQRRGEELRRIPAPEANQAVAADASCVYAIDNHRIAKYDKQTGKRLAGWECENGKPLIHLDSGVVHDGILYCAHSNFPGVPMVSSIEWWDAATLRHTGSHSFGIFAGSATWVDRLRGRWYVTFAHYRGASDEPSRDPRWTALVEFGPDWQPRQSWVYPADLVAKLGNYSISGGVFTPGGKLLATGHDNAELYVLGFPEGGSTLIVEDTIPIPMHGQGIALDPADPTLLYGIDRARREIVTSRLPA